MRLMYMAVLLLAAGQTAQADPASVGKLAGIVTYDDGQVAAGATVVISEAKTAIRRAVATTDARGRYEAALT
ncbi:MAG TPA: hypothetical protein VGC42_09450, partial [Kofleriaceae bacterium]